MNNRMSTSVLSALVLGLAAGAASSTHAQVPEIQTRAPGAVASTPDFRSSKWLIARSVVNNNGEEIANVSDLILDRGAGRIEHVVVKTGTTFGLGGRAIVIPYGSFRWESGAKERFVLALTAEQLKQFPEYTPESWKAMKDSARDDTNALRQKLDADASWSSDPYAGGLDTAKSARIAGEIKNVERVRTSAFGEQVVITVEAEDGSSKKIALGPSWYINGAPAAPMRGDKVVVETLALPRDPEQLLAGTDLRTGDRDLRLRNSDGTPAWALKSVESGGKNSGTPHSRYLLLSNLPGMKVDCRGNECGKVHDIILDRTSGEVAFLSIDPNQNFLGVGDTKRLVPWSIATVTLDGVVRIDASKEMVLASPETPADLSTLNSGPTIDAAYKAYMVPAPHFTAPKPISAAAPGKDNAWSARGPIIAGIDRASAKTIEGTLTDITEVTFEKDIQPARALKIRTTGEGNPEELVLLGPVWYMENQTQMCKSGDSVKLDAVRTTIQGKTYWIARSIDNKNNRVQLLDESNTPAWAKP